jgi:endonuclease/exonuclease/phosphatase family metal-dependent hydrolase
MKLVTFNIRCDYGQDGVNNFCNRKPLILEKILSENPDIICFQEVLPHVAVWLKDNLKDYYIIGCGRDEKLQNEQTSIAYKKSILNLLEMEVFWLSEAPKVPGSRYTNQSDCPRVCTMALFQNLETNEVFRVYNTHLDHIGSEARTLGLSQILNKISQENTFIQAPVIITGDFNAFPNSVEMEPLESYPWLIDLTANIEGTFHDFGRMKELEKIDYIIAQDNILCNQVSIWDEYESGVYLSDHYPVCVEILVNSSVR